MTARTAGKMWKSCAKWLMNMRSAACLEFLQNLALVSDQDTMAEQTDVPTLMTLHAVKGLEFNRVFIVGMDDGILPHSRSLDDPEEMAEERRLLYVGMTRARNQLTLVRAGQRMAYGVPDITFPSRFLSYIPDHLIRTSGQSHQSAYKQSSFSRHSDGKNTRWESQPQWAAGIGQRFGGGSRSSSVGQAERLTVRQKFAPQDSVEHPLWGEGTILESIIEDGEEVVQVQFKNGSSKRLIVSLSKIKKL